MTSISARDLPAGHQAPPWVLVTVPLAAWAVIDAIRQLRGRPTRSQVAEDVLRRTLAVDAPVEELSR